MHHLRQSKSTADADLIHNAAQVGLIRVEYVQGHLRSDLF